MDKELVYFCNQNEQNEEEMIQQWRECAVIETGDDLSSIGNFPMIESEVEEQEASLIVTSDVLVNKPDFSRKVK